MASSLLSKIRRRGGTSVFLKSNSSYSFVMICCGKHKQIISHCTSHIISYYESIKSVVNQIIKKNDLFTKRSKIMHTTDL